MDDFSLGFCEVIPDQTLPEKWKEITLNTGGTQSTLQDIKVPERSGGYCYKDSSKYYTRNRFIYWRINHDVLELVEQSLDVNLVGNNVRYKFQDTPVLEGITIHETYSNVIVLVATVYSVHKLSFPHPDKIHKMDHLFASHPDLSVQSIFSEASPTAARDPATFHVINSPVANAALPHTSASWLAMDEEALFALAYTSGSIVLIRMDPASGGVLLNELKEETLVPRFLSGLAGAFRSRTNASSMTVSVALHSLGLETYLFALGHDGTLRMWSCSRAQCVAVVDVVHDAGDVGQGLGTQGAQNYVLRKAVSSHDSQLYLGVYLCYAAESEFCILRPVNDSGTFRFVRTCTVYAPEHDLVDFSLSSRRLWAVWLTAQGEVTVSSARLEEGSPKWQPAVLEQPPERDSIPMDPFTDPRQAYVSYIFHPGQFSLSVITRALSIYRRSSLLSDVTVSRSALLERVCLAVEAEVQAEVQDYEVSDDEYLEVCTRCWSRLYSCCVQYQQAGARPLGVCLLDQGGVVVIKRQQCSLLRPMDALEHLFLVSPDLCTPQQFSTTPVFCEDPEVSADVLKLMAVLVSIESQLPDDLKAAFERELYQLKSPDQTVVDISRELMVGADKMVQPGFMSDLQKRLEYVRDIYSAVLMLVQVLTLDLDQPRGLVIDDTHSEASRLLLAVSHLYSSHFGMSTVAQSLHQIALVRFSICRDLLLLQQLLLDCGARLSVSLEAVRSVLLPRTVLLTQAYYVLVWACKTPAAPRVPESSLLRLAVLRLDDAPVVSRRSQQRSLTLLELFLQGAGVEHAHQLLSRAGLDEDLLPVWHHSLLPYIIFVGQLVWPVSSNFVFPEFLLASGQHLLIQEYVRLLQSWCEWNNCSRKFLLGSALLSMGEPHKAYDLLVQAAKGVTTDVFMSSRLIGPVSDQASDSRLLVLYYLKVIKMFEQQKWGDCVIAVATTAIGISEPDDPDLPTLHSVVFSHHLALGHHEEAYHALIANPDAARRKDCLRQMVVTLFERRQLETLAEFPYQGMYEDLERIVEARARSLDVLRHDYYNFLFAFHTKKGNLRKSASIMYEQSLRLGQESDGTVEYVKRQARCLLACLNALRLVSKKYAWIVKPLPVVANEFESGELPPGLSPKRSNDGEEVYRREKRQVQVVELSDIKREFELASARLLLYKYNQEHFSTASRMSPPELSGVLTSVGLYQAALKLCKLFKLSPQPVLEGLASACVRLSAEQSDREGTSSAWDWLAENQLSELGIGDAPVATLAWRLLEALLSRTEEPNQSTLHKAVTWRLLTLGAELPLWLELSYKSRNAAELLRLLLASGRLEASAALAQDYVWAVLGHGPEYFGLPGPLMPSGPATCLPLNTFDMLLLELAECPEYREIYADLKGLVDHYLDKAMEISEEMVSVARSM